MYSIVMLTALSAGADVTPPPPSAPKMTDPGTPAVVLSGCSGCCGVVVVGCSGCSGCYGCYGSCHGGGLFKRGLFSHKSSCYGCCGGCCGGYSCTGCTGYSCFGSCTGCCGGGISYGSSWGPPVGMLPYTLHGYNSGSTTVWGAGPPVVLGNLTATTTDPNRPPAMTIPVAPMTKPMSSDGTPMGANLKFTVPADTKLFVDGKLTPGSGTERSFYTPPLAKGQKFFYDVKAELVVDGKKVVEEKKVIVESGANLSESFPVLVAALEKSKAVAGK